MSDIRSMAAALDGVVQKGKRGVFVLCPGPGHSAGDRSLSVAPSKSDPEGFVCSSFAGDPWQDCRDHVRARLGMPAFGRDQAQSNRAREEVAHDGPPAREGVSAPVLDDGRGAASRIWREAVDPRGTLVEHYLNQHRGLVLPDDLCGRVVRFCAACSWGEGIRHPAMITAFRSITDDSLQAIHRTALKPDGQKIGRRMLGPVGGAAIKIDADVDVEQGLSICEGFETGLAARVLGFRPVWALGSAGAIGAFPVLAGVDTLTIMGESDKNGTNEANALACARRWRSAGQEAEIVFPTVGGDMNDLMQR